MKAGANGYVEYTIDLQDIEVAEEEEAELVAWVNVDGDTNAANDKVTKVVPVVNGETAEPTFSVAAQDVTVGYGDASFTIEAVVKNTSDVDAQGLTVKLLKGITEVQTKTLDLLLAAGEETTVTFTVNAPEEGFTAGKAIYYVQAGNAQAEVNVTFEGEPVVKTIDMAITAIQGLTQIDLSKENKVTVWYENVGEQDLENVVIMFSVNDDVQEQTVNVKAGRNGHVEFTLDVTSILPEDENAEIVAWVNVEGDVNPDNNKVTKVVPVIAGEAVLSYNVLDVYAEKDAASFDVVVKVKNSGAVAAENVEVSVYDAQGSLLATETVETIAAGEEVDAVVTIEKTYTETGVYRNELQVVVKGVEGSTWKSVTVLDDVTSIAAVKAQMENGARVYTLGGAKVNTIKKGGIYIVNGRKVTVK